MMNPWSHWISVTFYLQGKQLMAAHRVCGPQDIHSLIIIHDAELFMVLLACKIEFCTCCELQLL